jgi:hypothetical protein
MMVSCRLKSYPISTERFGISGLGVSHYAVVFLHLHWTLFQFKDWSPLPFLEADGRRLSKGEKVGP